MGDKPNNYKTTNERLFRILIMEQGTYTIENYTVIHPTAGELTKQKITYYNQRNEIVTVEYYDGSIRNGYVLR